MKVDPQAFEHRLAQLAAQCSQPTEGFFGPDSASWELGRDVAVFLGSGCAILLQLAHPPVTFAIAKHSNIRVDPLGRFHRTFDAVHALIFGDLAAGTRAARRVHSVHREITGEIGEDLGRFRRGQPFHAIEIESLIWVWMTLVHTAIAIHRRVRPALTRQLLDQYYDECLVFGELFGIPLAAMPRDYTHFEQCFASMVDSSSIAIGETAREISNFIFSSPRRLAYVPLAVVEAATAVLVPERVRVGFGLELSWRQRQLFELTLAALRRSSARGLPRHRELPAAIEARRRLSGRSGPDQLGRAVEQALLQVVRPRTL